MSEELWRPIPAPFKAGYEVSNMGRVRSGLSGNNQKPRTATRIRSQVLVGGYFRVHLMLLVGAGRRTRLVSVHRLVTLAFLGPSDLTVNHKNGNKLDNRCENLEYLSAADNRRHAVENRLHPHGVRVNTAKLSEDDVLAMREARSRGVVLTALAERFGVSVSGAHRVVTGRSWKHVGGLR